MQLFAASLFFAGISTRLHARAPRSVVLGLGYALFLGTVVWILTFPVNVPVRPARQSSRLDDPQSACPTSPLWASYSACVITPSSS